MYWPSVSVRLGSARLSFVRQLFVDGPIADRASSEPGQWPRGTKVVFFARNRSSLHSAAKSGVEEKKKKKKKEYDEPRSPSGREKRARTTHASRYAQETTRGELKRRS